MARKKRSDADAPALNSLPGVAAARSGDELLAIDDATLDTLANGVDSQVTITVTPQMIRARREQRRRLIGHLQEIGKLPTPRDVSADPRALGEYRRTALRPVPGAKRFTLAQLRHIPVSFASPQAHDAIMVRGHYESRKLPAVFSEYFGACPHVASIVIGVVLQSAHFPLTDEVMEEHRGHLAANPLATVPDADPEDGPWLVDVLIVADPQSGYPDHRFLFPARDLYLLDARTREPLARAQHTAETLFGLYPHKNARIHHHPAIGPRQHLERSGVRLDINPEDDDRQPSELDHTAVVDDGSPIP